MVKTPEELLEQLAVEFCPHAPETAIANYRYKYDCRLCLADAIRQAIAETREENKQVLEKYNELIMAVAQKWPNETRHETALRYIREREERFSTDATKAEQDQQPSGM